jgi:potassium-dependent mechanosensitive channel
MVGKMNPEEVVVQHTWREILHLTFDVLNYQLFELDGHGVSLGKLVTGIVLLIMSYIVSRRGAKEVDRRLLTKMNVDDSLRYTLQRLIFYFFVCLTTLFTLHILAVPVTIFTVIGGALAVGIGFGSQNLVNNFISGVLVMVERPIRVGDYIDVDGVSGQVENIGIRSTVVRVGTNAVTVIPNTTFIEKNLTNWTMSEYVGCTVRIGVAKDTDVKLLAELCLNAVKDLDLVTKVPAPTVSFSDFGESALLFDISYSIHASAFPNRGAVASNLRFRLNDLFKENKIVFPFPQRQVHVAQGLSALIPKA